MNTSRLVCSAGCIIAGLSAINAVAADNCSGYDNLVTVSSETLDLGGGHTLTFLRQLSALTSDDAPVWNLVTGECSGTVLTTPDGKARALGHCLRRDKDGDSASIEWGLTPGADRGYWKFTGGTGKFSQRGGSGWAEQVRADGKIEQVKWGGNCK
jgi:hypothetical protein